MPVGTPFLARTFQLCESLSYRDWSGYYTVSAYEAHHEHEYNAIRNAAALIDVSPLFKYVIAGPDASTLVNRVITGDVGRMAAPDSSGPRRRKIAQGCGVLGTTRFQPHARCVQAGTRG